MELAYVHGERLASFLLVFFAVNYKFLIGGGQVCYPVPVSLATFVPVELNFGRRGPKGGAGQGAGPGGTGTQGRRAGQRGGKGGRGRGGGRAEGEGASGADDVVFLARR